MVHFRVDQLPIGELKHFLKVRTTLALASRGDYNNRKKMCGAYCSDPRRRTRVYAERKRCEEMQMRGVQCSGNWKLTNASSMEFLRPVFWNDKIEVDFQFVAFLLLSHWLLVRIDVVLIIDTVLKMSLKMILTFEKLCSGRRMGP